MAWAKPWNQYLSCDLDRIVLMGCSVESLFDSIDDIVSNLEIMFGHLLVPVNFFDQLFDML
jgi:hypothetical protein